MNVVQNWLFSISKVNAAETNRGGGGAQRLGIGRIENGAMSVEQLEDAFGSRAGLLQLIVQAANGLNRLIHQNKGGDERKQVAGGHFWVEKKNVKEYQRHSK